MYKIKNFLIGYFSDIEGLEVKLEQTTKSTVSVEVYDEEVHILTVMFYPYGVIIGYKHDDYEFNFSVGMIDKITELMLGVERDGK